MEEKKVIDYVKDNPQLAANILLYYIKLEQLENLINPPIKRKPLTFWKKNGGKILKFSLAFIILCLEIYLLHTYNNEIDLKIGWFWVCGFSIVFWMVVWDILFFFFD